MVEWRERTRLLKTLKVEGEVKLETATVNQQQDKMCGTYTEYAYFYTVADMLYNGHF